MKAGLGYRIDQPDARDFDLKNLGLSEGPESSDLRPYVVSVLDQGPLPSCVGQAVPQAVRVAEKAGNPSSKPPLTSRFFAWYYARLQHGDQENLTGTYIRTAVKALNQLGRPPESAWPQVTNDLSSAKPKYATRPPPNVSMQAYDNRRIVYHRIYETGYERRLAVQAALGAKRPVAFGTNVGYSFTTSSGQIRNIEPPVNEGIAGGHAMVLVGHDQDGCWLCNSWGTDWRENGFAHISWDYVQWVETRDLWALALEAA